MPELVLLGPPGSGKGTQGQPLAAALGVPFMSVGELLRAAGPAVRRFTNAGELVPDPVVFEIVRDALPAAGGFVLDGYPRTVAQAERLDHIARVAAVLLDAPDDAVITRLRGRGRHDDTPATIRRRLALYHEQTEPLLNYYGERLTRIDGTAAPEQVRQALLARCVAP
jgi:adenylate kinase